MGREGPLVPQRSTYESPLVWYDPRAFWRVLWARFGVRR